MRLLIFFVSDRVGLIVARRLISSRAQQHEEWKAAHRLSNWISNQSVVYRHRPAPMHMAYPQLETTRKTCFSSWRKEKLIGLNGDIIQPHEWNERGDFATAELDLNCCKNQMTPRYITSYFLKESTLFASPQETALLMKRPII